MRTKYFFLIIIGIALVACKKNSDQSLVQINFTANQKALLKSSNSFGLGIFNQLATDLPADSNLFISPLSISIAMTMAYNGAAGQTALDMQNTLGFENMNKTAINQSFKDLIYALQNCDPKVQMEIANSIWYRNTFAVNKSFLDTNRNYFSAEVTSANFNDAQTVNLINNWVSAKTNGKIDKIINSIDPDLMMYLINAIYFKGTWKYEFEKSKTAKSNFQLGNGFAYLTDFMVQKSNFGYYQNDFMEVVELPYGNGNFSMNILVPKSGKTYRDILKNLDQTNWETWNNALKTTSEVQVYLPKFKIEYSKKLNEVLSLLGMAIAFDPIKADFSNIDGNKDLVISEVMHKSYVEVNEEGTVAAAVTSVGFTTTAYPAEGPILFKADKPFIFAIKEQSTNSILFMGVVQKPLVK